MSTPIVYFVQAASGPIKIGFTGYPMRKRFNGLQGMNHEKLHILGYVEGSLSLERQLHEELSPYRIRGEWFEPTDVVIQTIIRILDPLSAKAITRFRVILCTKATIGFAPLFTIKFPGKQPRQRWH